MDFAVVDVLIRLNLEGQVFEMPKQEINLSTSDLLFSEQVISVLLKDGKHISEETVENLVRLEKHWCNVDFELKFEITEHCNLNCTFCHQEFGKKKTFKSDFPLDDYKNIIDSAKREKQIKYIRVTGGEPLLHPHIKDFLQYAAQAGFCTILNTNATLLSAEEIADLSPWVGIWKISLPSFNAEQTDLITQTSDTWKKKIKSLELLQKSNCNVDLLIVLTPENIPHIRDFVAIANEYGTTFSFLRQESNVTEKNPLTQKDVETMVSQLEINKASVGLGIPFCAISNHKRLAAVASGRIDCGPYSSLVVRNSKKVHQCYSRRVLYEISGGFIKTAMQIAAVDFARLPPQCQSCQYGAVCLGGCRCAMSLKDSPNGKIDYLANLNSFLDKNAQTKKG